MDNYYVVAGFYNRFSSEDEELRSRAEEMYLRRIELEPENEKGYAYLAQFYDFQQPCPALVREWNIGQIPHVLLSVFFHAYPQVVSPLTPW